MATNRLQDRQDDRAKTAPLKAPTGKLKPPTGKLKPPSGRLKGTGPLKPGTSRTPSAPLKPKYTTAQLRLPPSRRRKKGNPVLRRLVFGLFAFGLAGLLVLNALFSFLQTLSPQAHAKFGPIDFLTSLMPLTGRHNILLLGTDWDYSAGHRLSDGPSRSDTMMVLGVDADHGRLNLISVPRDTRVLIRGHYEKINAAMAIGGPELSAKVVSQLLGVPIDAWATINTNGLQRLVDVMGGVRLYVDKDMYYVDETAHLGINIHKGWHLMNGAQAHQFVRFRHDALGDIGRVQRQQEFLRAVEQQLLTPGTLFKVPQLLHTIQDNITTNLSGSEMLKLMLWAPHLRGQHLHMVMLPGAFSGAGFNQSYWLVNPDSARDLGEHLLAGASTDHVTQSALRLTVLNGSSDSTLGAQAARVLRDAGWNVWSIGDAPDHDHRRTEIIPQTGHEEFNGAIARALGVPAHPVDASVGDLSTDFTIIVGDDFARLARH
ncbi:MAG TPA: LCP family protein [Oscillatoriaceae cyanobacterium]